MKVADDYIKKNAVIVHAVAVAEEYNENQNKEFSEFLYIISSNYHDLACYDKSISFLNLRQSINLKLYGEQHPIIAKTYDNLALAFCDKGDYQSSLDFTEHIPFIRPQAGRRQNSLRTSMFLSVKTVRPIHISSTMLLSQQTSES